MSLETSNEIKGLSALLHLLGFREPQPYRPLVNSGNPLPSRKQPTAVTMTGLAEPVLQERSRNVTTADNVDQLPGAARQGLLTHHPLVFFIIAYAGTWLVEMPYGLSEDGAGLCRLVVLCWQRCFPLLVSFWAHS
jgi:hypothetical protein